MTIVNHKPGLLFILLLFGAGPLLAQEENIDPERPDQSDSPSLLDKKVFQAEFGFNKNNQRGENYELAYPTALLRYGLSHLELRLQGNIVSDYEKLIPEPRWQSGISGVAIGIKLPLLKERHGIPETSLISSLGIPGLSSKAFRPNHLAPSIILAMENTLSKSADLTYNFGAQWDGFSNDPSWIYALSQGFDFCNKWTSYIEFYGSFHQHQASQESVDAGLGYCISPNCKIDFSGGFGISDSAPKSYLAIGFSFRLLPSGHK